MHPEDCNELSAWLSPAPTLETRLVGFASRLRREGHHVTRQRMATLRALLECGYHPSAEELLCKVAATHPAARLGTIRRALSLLTQLGEALVIPTSDGARYDARVTPHAHLVCTRCNAVSDLNRDGLNLVMQVAPTARGEEFSAAGVRVLGLCPRCGEQSPPAVAGCPAPIAGWLTTTSYLEHLHYSQVSDMKEASDERKP